MHRARKASASHYKKTSNRENWAASREHEPGVVLTSLLTQFQWISQSVIAEKLVAQTEYQFESIHVYNC